MLTLPVPSIVLEAVLEGVEDVVGIPDDRHSRGF
jgi:hypothetical protein